jgi:hypothetical protein
LHFFGKKAPKKPADEKRFAFLGSSNEKSAADRLRSAFKCTLLEKGAPKTGASKRCLKIAVGAKYFSEGMHGLSA